MSCIEDVGLWMSSNRLKLNADKTQFTCLGTRYQLAKVGLPGSTFTISGSNIELLRAVTCLGVVVDQQLTFSEHVRRLAGRCFYWLRQLRTIRRIVTTDAAVALVNALVISRIDYCNGVLSGIYDIHMRQLQSVLNAAARLVARKRKYESITSTIRDDLHWLPVRQRVSYKLGVLMYNCLHQLAPIYLISMCQLVSTVSGRRHLRSAAHGDFVIPSTRTVRYGPRSFAVAGPTLWNSLPLTLRDFSLSPTSFRHRLKTELYHRAYTHS
jgi:hypothetical protein